MCVKADRLSSFRILSFQIKYIASLIGAIYLGGYMIYIFAGKKFEADDWARKHGYNPNEVKYISNCQMLRGISRNFQYVQIGTWFTRNDTREIAKMLMIRGAVNINRVVA